MDNKKIDYGKFWSTAFDNMTDFIFIIDKDFNIVEVNKSFLDFAKKKKADIVGKKCYEIMHSKNFPLEGCPHKETLSKRTFASNAFYETSLKRWLQVRTTPIFNDRNDVIGTIHIATDVTEKMVVEMDMARMAAIVESSDDAIISKALDGTIISWNKGAEKIYGYSVKEALGRNISILLPPDRSDEISKLLQKIETGKTVEHFETIRLTKDGREIDVSVTISPVKDAAGNIVGASTIARDITRRKQMEEDLKKRIEMLERFQKVTVGRELKMKELKTRIAELEAAGKI